MVSWIGPCCRGDDHGIPGSVTRQGAAHHEGISPRGLVIAPPDPDLGEVVPAVQLLRTVVVCPYLEEDLGAAAPGCLGQQRPQQRGADPPAPAVGRHRERQHVALPARSEQAGVPGDPAVLFSDEVVPAGRLLVELPGEHLPAPCLCAEDVALEVKDSVDVGVRHRPQHDAHRTTSARLSNAGHGVTRFGRPAPWRRDGAGTAPPLGRAAMPASQVIGGDLGQLRGGRIARLR